MGKFSNKIKNIFNPKEKKTTQPEKQRMKLYFVRSVYVQNLFIHPDGTDVFKPVYALKETEIGAACFTNEMAELLIVNWLAEYGQHLEKVDVEDFIKTHGI